MRESDDVRIAFGGCVCLRSALSVLNLTHLGDFHTVVLEMSEVRDCWYIVSMYYSFSRALDPFLDRIRKISNALQGKRVVYCLDTNAKSPTWSPITNDRGKDLEDLLLKLDLHGANRPGSLATFISHSGSTFINVTFTNRPGEILDWDVTVTDDDVYHRLITFAWRISGSREAIGNAVSRFVVSKANWTAF